MESIIFLAWLIVKKSIACLTLSEKITSEATWVVALFNSCGFLAGGIFVRLVDHLGLRYVCKL